MGVLVVEDEMPLADAIARRLQRRGMDVGVSDDGDDGYERAQSFGYDVVVLDRDLPRRSGDEICQSVVSTGVPARVLMLTGSGSDDDRALGLELGASDYMSKPFQFTELVHRVQALGELTAAI